MSKSAPLHRDSRFTPIIAFFLSVSLFVSGCTTLTSVPVPMAGSAPVAPQFAVHVGDRVEIRTKYGAPVAFKVTAIDSDALVGGSTRVKFDDIAGLQVRRPDKRATTLTVAGLVILVLLIGTVAAVSAAGPGLVGG